MLVALVLLVVAQLEVEGAGLNDAVLDPPHLCIRPEDAHWQDDTVTLASASEMRRWESRPKER